MSARPFQLKEFRIEQDRCAMKVGTDGILLGAWVHIPQEASKLLDVGTGSGLIAMQLAQRSSADSIDAVELEPGAFEQAVTNFENSPWPDRLFCYHASFQEFATEVDETYDLIVSNPPFYTDTFKELKNERAAARHAQSLPFEELLRGTEKLLSKGGTCAFVLPYREECFFIDLAERSGLYPSRITRVKGSPQSETKRSLLQFSRDRKSPNPEMLVIEEKRHQYTAAYRELVRDFYLNM